MPEELVSFLPRVFILCLFTPLVFYFFFLAFIRIYNLYSTESSMGEGTALHICDFEIPLSITVMNIALYVVYRGISNYCSIL